MVGRIMMIFVAKIEIETEPLHIVIVAVCRDITLLQQPNLTISQWCRYFKHRMISNFPYIALIGGVIQLAFLEDR